MESYYKVSSTKKQKNCNCISPFYINDISGINPNTGHDYTTDDVNILKTALFRVSNARGCDVSVCCDPNDPTSTPDANFTNQFLQKYPKILPMYEGSKITSIKLSTTNNVSTSGWIIPNSNMICKITKATISDTSDPTIKLATNLVKDCFTDQCTQAESITVNNLLQNAKNDMSYTFVDDARVTQAISESNITYVKEYVRKYKQVDSPLTNDSYNNRMIHIASQSKSIDILNMLIALKANLNITNKLNETPIHFAVRSGNLDNIDALLTQGVDLSISTTKGETPMFYAMVTGDMRIINMLYNNSSKLLSVDISGNNLIHHCILNCPTFKNNDDDDTKDASNSIPNTKSEIINFLISHGVSSEQKNNNGITPLVLTSGLINKETNKECALNISTEDTVIREKFFNVKPLIKNNKNIEKFTNSNGASHSNIDKYTDEHKSLLEIQSSLFNNIIRNNPSLYNGYISVDDIPKGAPIEILDTVCYGSGMTGNEDSDECISKGGQIVKITNRTTKIKLELTDDNDIDIDSVDNKDLYFNKNPTKLPKKNIPANVNNYNSVINNSIKSGSILNVRPNKFPQTTGITYNIGQESSNILDSVENIMGFNPQPTFSNPSLPINNPNIIANLQTPSIADISSSTSIPPIISTDISLNHPPTFEEDDTVLRKCKSDAISNSINITQAQTTTPQTTVGNISVIYVFQRFKTEFIILFCVILVLIIAIVINNFIINKNNS